MTSPRRFSLLHPSRGRIRMAAGAIAEWRGRAQVPSRIEHLLSVDSDDPDRAEYEELARELDVRLLVAANRSIVDAMNRAAAASCGDVLVGMSDDFGCPEAWDDALDRLVGADLDVAVHVHDGGAARILTLPVLGRTLYERLGWIYHPAYFSMYADDDLTDVVQALGKLVDARHLLFPHRHWSDGHVPADPTYLRQNSGHAYRVGRRVYRKRRATRFGLAPPSLGRTLAVARIELEERARNPLLRARHAAARVRTRVARAVGDPARRSAVVDALARRLSTVVRRPADVSQVSTPLARESASAGPLPPLGWFERVPDRTATPASDAYGFSALERWRDAVEEVGRPAAASEGTSLRFRSLMRPGTPAGSHPHTLVDATNLLVDYARIGRRDVLRHRPGHLAAPGVYADVRWGALSGLCALADARVPIEGLGRDHLRDVFDGFRWSAVGRALPDADETVEHPVLFVAREPHEYANAFHAHTDLLAVYETLRILGISGDACQVILLDGNPPGPFDGAFRRAFSRRHPIRRLEEHGHRRVRYRHAVFVPPGYCSFLHAGTWDGVVPAGVVDSLADYGAYLLAAHDVVPVPRAAGGSVRTTVISRRPYRDGVDRSYLRRRFANEDEIVTALDSLDGVRTTLVDLAALPLAEQLRMVAETDLLVGAHGAGLAHLPCLPRGASVVEIVPEPVGSTPLMYANLAAYRGAAWTSVAAREARGLHGTFLRPDPAAVRAAAERLLEASARSST